MQTCLPTSNNFSYMMLNLVGEVGELASKVGKSIRKGWLAIDHNKVNVDPSRCALGRHKLEEQLKAEAGDILWQLSGLCSAMCWSLEEIAQGNLDKLASRKAQGTIDGQGDGTTREERSNGIGTGK